MPPTLDEVRCPGIADPVIHGQASAVLEPTPHVSGLSGDIVEIFWATLCTPSTPRGRQLLIERPARLNCRVLSDANESC